MIAKINRLSPTPPFAAFAAVLTCAVDRIRTRTTPTSELEELRQLLETIPLSTSEYGMAGNRLRNAVRYLRSHEWGAAQWELRTLLNGLTRDLEPAAERAVSNRRSSQSSRRPGSERHWILARSER